MRSRKAAAAVGVLAAAFWSPHFQLVQRLTTGESPPSRLVLSFYFVLGAAIALSLVLFLTGRLSELRVFNRQETHFLLLAATGGYGFWVLRALALAELAPAPARAHLLFCAVPIFIAVLSVFAAERADGRTFIGLLLGFFGCVVLVVPGHLMAGSLRGTLLALAAAACWALFTLAARSLMRQEKALPVVALVTAIGAACLLVTCLSTRESIFAVRPDQLGMALAGGFFTVGIMTALWLRCLAVMPAVLAAGFWYLGTLFGAIWAFLGWGGDRPNVWWLLVGGALILLGLHGALSGRRTAEVTLGDVIRGS